nr:hypothetical protein [Gemmatimonadota bacterium]
PLFSAAGIVWLYDRLGARERLRRLYYPVVGTAIAASAVLLIFEYSRSVMFREAHFQNFLVHLGTRVGRYDQNHEQVYLELYGSHPYVYVAAFGGIAPKDFQMMGKVGWSNGMDHFTRLGKFQWLTREALAAARDSAIATGSDPLFVSMSPLEGLTAIDSVTFQQEKAWLMVRPRAE